MPAKTLDVESLQAKTGNIYETLSVMSKRARQIAAKDKLELDEKLKYFEGFDDDDDFSFNEEQERISKEYEKKAHSTERAIDEMMKDEIYFRRAEDF
ncbi:MAG: DNA-directed RNA polymerase subunit omega [Bacteroidetes bacterium]|nr:DNA-directed RNA polymerase subunit omega [Bacteroidota bacterium]NCQ11064.1 DNA-directed RNA polymerase subunit omega [Bacteroidota bacterium]